MSDLDDERRLLPLLAKLPSDELAALLAEHLEANATRDELCRALGIKPRQMKKLLARARERM